jgi:hypothetical protein
LKPKKPDQGKLTKYIQRIEAAEKWRDSGYRDKWEQYYKRYRNHVDVLKDKDGKTLKDRSNISIPYSFTMVETVLPRLVESLFAARPYVAVKGRPKDISEYKLYGNAEQKPWEISAEKNEQLLDYQMNVAFDIQDQFHIGLKTMTIYGTTVAYTGWKYDEKKIIRKEMANATLDGQPMMEMNQETQQMEPIQKMQPFESKDTVYDDPELRFIDLGLHFVDPNAEDIEDARFAGHVCFESKAFIQAMNDSGVWYVDWTKVPKDSGKRNEARDRRMGSVGLPTSKSYNGDQDTDSDQYEVHYYWEDDKAVVIINRGYLARDSENPYWHKKKPYVKDVYCKVPGEYYGIGLMEITEDLQDELNVERNQRIDNRSRSLRRFYTQRRGSKITPSDFDMKNGGRVLVDNHDDLKEWEHVPLPSDTFTQEDIIKRDMQDATGAHDVVMGGGSNGGTATETMSKDNNSSMRFKIIISSVEKRLLVGISRLMIQMNQQFIDAPRLLETSMDGNGQLLELSPEEIQGEFRLVAMGSSVEPLANKEAHKQRMMELFGVASQDPFFQQFPVKRRNLLQKVFESFDITNTEDLLPTDEELAQFEQQQAMQQQQQIMIQQQQSDQQASQAQQGQQIQQQKMQQDAGFKAADIQIKQQGMANKAMQAEKGLQAVK